MEDWNSLENVYDASDLAIFVKMATIERIDSILFYSFEFRLSAETEDLHAPCPYSALERCLLWTLCTATITLLYSGASLDNDTGTCVNCP